MAIKSSSIAAREEGSWSKVSPRPCGGKSSQRGRQVKPLAHFHLDWLCEDQIALLADFWHPLQKLCDRHYPWCCSLCSASTDGRLLHQPVSQGPQNLLPSVHIFMYAYMQHVHLICNTYFPFPYSSHIMVIFAIVIIIVYSLHCLTNIPTTSGLESGGAWGTTFFRDFCQIKNKYDFDIHTVMKR